MQSDGKDGTQYRSELDQIISEYEGTFSKLHLFEMKASWTKGGNIMERNAIYFPYMSVPKNRWFTQLLLYWDQVHSIIPRQYADQPSSLNSYMESLIDTKLVNPLKPGKYIHRIPRFTEAFLEYIDALKRPASKDPHLIEKVDTYELHVEKMGDIPEGLCERGLARRIDYDRYEVERSTADQFMAYLAGSLGRLPEIRSDPVTDERINLNSFDPRLQNSQSPNI